MYPKDADGMADNVDLDGLVYIVWSDLLSPILRIFMEFQKTNKAFLMVQNIVLQPILVILLQCSSGGIDMMVA